MYEPMINDTHSTQIMYVTKYGIIYTDIFDGRSFDKSIDILEAKFPKGHLASTNHIVSQARYKQ